MDNVFYFYLCVCVCTNVCRCPCWTGKDIEVLGVWGGCELHDVGGWWESNSGPFQEHRVHSSQSPVPPAQVIVYQDFSKVNPLKEKY